MTPIPESSAVVHASPVHDFAPLIARAHALSEAGSYGEALAVLVGELSQYPASNELLFARASVWFDSGRIREALAGFRHAMVAGLDRTALYLNLAWSCQLMGMPEAAEPHARRAIELEPDNVAAHFGLGTILQRLRRYQDAVDVFHRVLEMAPEHAQAAAGIARCSLDQEDHAEAETWFRRAVELAPMNPNFRTNLGVAIVNQGRCGEALEVFRDAAKLESIQGGVLQSMVDTGFALAMAGRYYEALELYRKNLPVLPDPRAHGYYAFLLLVTGQLLEGWEQYEFRWMLEPSLSRRPNFRQPQWGGQALDGKTILLLGEQGVGDIIHFVRFALPLKALGANVVLQVRPELLALAQGFDGIDVAISPSAPLPPFDYYLPLMSVPRVLGVDLTNIPADVPYVRVERASASRWTGRITGHGLKVGIAWAGNPKYPRDRYRSIAFDHLRVLWDVQGVNYFSLQKPLKVGELEKFPSKITLDNLGPELPDFTDTGAAIEQLDLVICVDTAIAHLAGALGKQVWLMLPAIGDFRWFEVGEASPWYPTMRLFRQRVLGEWDEVIERVKNALQQAARTGLLPVDVQASAELGLDHRKSLHVQNAVSTPAPIARVSETRHGILQYLPGMDDAAQSLACYGEYLQPQLELLSRLIRPGAYVVEAGCGIGEHTIALAKMVGAEGHVIAYETRPLVQQILRQNIDANRVSSTVTLMRRALAGPRQGSHEQQNDRPEIHATLAPTGKASAETLDELLLDRLDLLKTRSAASAAEILDGAADTLWRVRPFLFLAGADATAVDLLAEKVSSFGYRSWRMETPYFDPDNFNCRNVDLLDGQLGWALLAVPEEANVQLPFDRCIELTDIAKRAGVPTPAEVYSRSASPEASAGHDRNSLGLGRLLRKLRR